MRPVIGHLFAATALVLALAACESVNHENIDRWLTTEKGPGKLEETLAGDYTADLRAHAAQNMVQLGKTAEVAEAFETMDAKERTAVLAELAPRLWENARIEGEMTAPTGAQAAAKDALYDLRRFADDATRGKIDGYLIDWFAGGYYEGRSTVGRVTGNMAVRAVGPAFGPKLVEAARSILAVPPDEEGKRPMVGDRLLEGLAFSGHPEALGLLLDLIENPRGDDTLPKRASGALVAAYVEPVGVEAANGKALAPVLDRLVGLARNEELPGVINNDAVDLIAAAGMPECLPPFVDMVSYPHTEEAFRWMGAQRGIRCGGADAVVPIVEALPATVDYPRGMLNKYVWDEILQIPAKGRVAEVARTLLSSDSWVARVSGAELLAALARPAEAAEDAKRIRKLADDDRVLKGWWSKSEGSETRPDPTLGQVAEAAASRLEDVANGANSK